MNDPLGLARGISRAVTRPPAELAHPALYETCAALIVAVMVVIYFDERVRRGLTSRLRGYAIGSLGGIVGTGLLVPLFALGGFMGDTAAIRAFTVGYTLVFLVVAFGFAVHIWGTEDGQRLRRAQSPPITRPPTVPLPRGGQTERERAAEVLGAAMANLAHAHPAVVMSHLARNGPGPEAERLRNLTAQWITLQPYLIALSAGYPSANVRKHTAVFVEAASQVMQQTASLFADTQTTANDGAKAEWHERSTASYDVLQAAYDAVVSALHTTEASNGRRPRAKPRTEPSKPGAA